MMREGCMYIKLSYLGDKIGQEDFNDFNELNKYLRDLEKNDISTFNCITYVDYRFCFDTF